MALRSFVFASAFALLLTACGPDVVYRPDGGGVVRCEPETEIYLAVAVTDADGEPVEDANVVAKNLSTGMTVTGTTNGDGVTTAVGTSLGSGSIEVFARLNTRESERKQVEFVCGECSCDIQPDAVTLQIPN